MKPRFLDKIKHRLVFFGSLFFVTFGYSHSANAQSCRDLGYTGTHIDIIERPGGANETQGYADIVNIQVPYSSLGILYPTPVYSTSFNFINNTNLNPIPARHTTSGGVLGQYGSPDFILISDGTFGGGSGDEFYAFKNTYV